MVVDLLTEADTLFSKIYGHGEESEEDTVAIYALKFKRRASVQAVLCIRNHPLNKLCL